MFHQHDSAYGSARICRNRFRSIFQYRLKSKVFVDIEWDRYSLVDKVRVVLGVLTPFWAALSLVLRSVLQDSLGRPENYDIY